VSVLGMGVAMSRAVKFLHLTQEEVIACGGLDMPATIAAVEYCLRLKHAGECIEGSARIPATFFCRETRSAIHCIPYPGAVAELQLVGFPMRALSCEPSCKHPVWTTDGFLRRYLRIEATE
jgi:hypothetical protein